MSGMYWYAVAASDDVAGLKNKGFCITDGGEILYNEQYDYSLVRMYTSDGHGIVDVDVDNFYFEESDSGALTINAIEPMTTPVKSYKIRMTDKYPGAQWFYFSPDQEDVLLANDTWMYLYEPNGTPAQEIYYRGMELEALNPIQSEDYEYSRFDGVEFGFRLHGGVGQLRIKFDSVVDNAGGEWSYGKRIRVLVTEPAAPSIPMGGVLTSTSDSVIRVPVEQSGGVVEVYSPTPALPTVTVISGIVGNDSSYGSRNISAGGSVYQWVNNGGTRELATVASGNVIAFQRIANGSGENVKYSGFDAQITQDGYVQVTNNTGSSYSGAFGLTTAVCSSDLATVVTVYNSSNVAYNAFKYTSDGTDYYYVLDGTQTDWTDDLSSIGYCLPMVGWMKADHTAKTISDAEWYDLYDDNGQLITSGFPDPFTSHSFIVINAYNGDNAVTCTFNQFDISTGHLKVNMDVGGQSVQYITYMETPPA